MARFVILHASDLHFGETPGITGISDIGPYAAFSQQNWHALTTHNFSAATALAAFAITNKQVDVMLLTGDLACRAKASDLYACWKYVLGQPSNDTPTLAEANLDLALVPGNHDRFTTYIDTKRNLPLYLPGSRLFDTFFWNQWQVGRQGVQEIWRGTKPDGSTLVLIGADFSLQWWDNGNFPFAHYGRGRVYKHHVDREPSASMITSLVAATRQARKTCPDCTIFWVFHFEPDTPSGSLKLLNDSRLQAAGEELGISTILCGHSHQTSAKKWGCFDVYTCGTTTSFVAQEGNCLQLLYIDISTGDPVQTAVQVQRFRYADMNGFLPV